MAKMKYKMSSRATILLGREMIIKTNEKRPKRKRPTLQRLC